MHGRSYRVLDAMVRADDDNRWAEYLLYHPGTGFTWLSEVEGDGGMPR
jgi:hypothetical protein